MNRIYNEFDEKSTTKKEGNLSRSPSVYEKDSSTTTNKNLASTSSKWATEKEKFLDTTRHLELVKAQYTEKNIDMLKNLNIETDKSKISKEPSELNTLKATPGAVLIKKSYIEPPKVARVSRSFHGKSNTAAAAQEVGRRASDSVPVVGEKAKRKLAAQKSPSRSAEAAGEGGNPKPRFTTTIVDEAEHAASVGLISYQRKRNDDGASSSGAEEKN